MARFDRLEAKPLNFLNNCELVSQKVSITELGLMQHWEVWELILFVLAHEKSACAN